MKKLVLFLFISLSLTAAVSAAEVKLDSAVVYLTAPEFTLPLRINSVNNLYGAALDLVYDTNLLELQDLDNDSSNGINPKVLEGGILNQAGIDSTVLMKGLEDKKEGKLVTGLVRDGSTGINVNAEGVLLSIGFRAKNFGIANLVFDSAALKDPYNSTIAASWINSNVTIYSSPADIEAVPSAYSLVLAQACDTSRALLIKNNGGEPLSFTLTDSTDWLTENITSGTIAKEDSTLININFAASALSYGLHTAQIEISSNDPDNSLVTIPISLLINNPPTAGFVNIPDPSKTGDGKVSVNIALSDFNGDINSLRVEYSHDGLTWNKAELGQVNATYGTPFLDNQNECQISGISANSGINNIIFYWISANDLPGIEDGAVYLRVKPNDGWVNGNINISSVFEIDNLAPQGLGNLSFLSKSISSAGLAFGPAVTDNNFKEYFICYDTAAITNGSSIWDKQKDANLGFQNFNNTPGLVITGLQDSTQYFFNIQAIDTFGNKSTSAAINVTTGQKRFASENMESILQAIEIAQDGDEVEVSPGIYYGNILISGKNIDLTGKNPLLTFLDSRNNGSVVSLVNTGYGSINNFTIMNGSGNLMQDSTNYAGGGIYCKNSALKIYRNIITGNHAGYGGGIYTQNSNVSIFNNTILANQAVAGAGIYAVGIKLPDITNCIIWETGDNLSGCTASYSDIKDGDAGEGNISLDPLFKNKNAFNLALNSNSPCIDAGRNIGLDYYGNLPDLGASEYSSTALAPVTNLIVQDTPYDSGGSIDISWTKSADDGVNSNSVQKYMVLRSANNIDYNVLTFLPNGTEEYKDTTVIAGTNYYYMVRTGGSEIITDSEIIGPVNSRENIPPGKPVFNTMPAVTNNPALNISGSSEPESLLTLYYNESLYSTMTVNNDSSFVFSNFTLQSGNNKFSAISKDRDGNISLSSETVNVILNNVLPADPVLIYPSESVIHDTTVNVKGRSDAGTDVYLEIRYETTVGYNAVTQTDSTGNFMFENASFVEGINNISLWAKNSAGNESAKLQVIVIVKLVDIEVNKTIKDNYPRVLVLVNDTTSENLANIIFADKDIYYKVVKLSDDFEKYFRSGKYNISMLLDNKEIISPRIESELIEHVNSGDGLIVSGTKAAILSKIAEVLGIKFKGYMPEQNNLVILDSTLNLDSTLQTAGKTQRVELTSGLMLGYIPVVPKPPHNGIITEFKIEAGYEFIMDSSYTVTARLYQGNAAAAQNLLDQETVTFSNLPIKDIDNNAGINNVNLIIKGIDSKIEFIIEKTLAGSALTGSYTIEGKILKNGVENTLAITTVTVDKCVLPVVGETYGPYKVTVVDKAGTCCQGGMEPAMVINSYGAGKAVFYAFDITGSNTAGNYEKIKEMLIRSVEYTTPENTSIYPMATLPVGINIKNNGKAVDLKIREMAPAGTEITEISGGGVKNGNEITWQINLLENENKELKYSLLVPDYAGTHTLLSEINYYDSALIPADRWQLIDNYMLEVEITHTMNELILEIINDLNGMSLSSGDRYYANEAVSSLNKILTRNVQTKKDLEKNIEDVLKAGKRILEITGADITSLRLKLDELLKINEIKWNRYGN